MAAIEESNLESKVPEEPATSPAGTDGEAVPSSTCFKFRALPDAA